MIAVIAMVVFMVAVFAIREWRHRQTQRELRRLVDERSATIQRIRTGLADAQALRGRLAHERQQRTR